MRRAAASPPPMRPRRLLSSSLGDARAGPANEAIKPSVKPSLLRRVIRARAPGGSAGFAGAADGRKKRGEIRTMPAVVPWVVLGRPVALVASMALHAFAIAAGGHA